MSSSMPLRDKPPANSPDPPERSAHTTTPLNIAKRDSAPPPEKAQKPPLARRQSSSYKILRNNHLVSKSPFRSGIPTPSKASAPLSPSSQRASGEKRPRPSSMHSQAENEHPLGFKRRQSQVFQGLLQKEPVSKSPFKQTSAPSLEDAADDEPPPVPPKPYNTPISSPSPTRPSLVSKRLHGPRTSNSGLHARRKTVTFDERCDVVEFDIDEDMLDPSHDSEQDQHDPFDDEANFGDPSEADGDYSNAEGSLPGSDAIAGLVSSMLQEEDNTPHTPPRSPEGLPADLETEDGVPLGRTHHAERLAYHHSYGDQDYAVMAPSPSPSKHLDRELHIEHAEIRPIGVLSPSSSVEHLRDRSATPSPSQCLRGLLRSSSRSPASREGTPTHDHIARPTVSQWERGTTAHLELSMAPTGAGVPEQSESGNLAEFGALDSDMARRRSWQASTPGLEEGLPLTAPLFMTPISSPRASPRNSTASPRSSLGRPDGQAQLHPSDMMPQQVAAHDVVEDADVDMDADPELTEQDHNMAAPEDGVMTADFHRSLSPASVEAAPISMGDITLPDEEVADGHLFPALDREKNLTHDGVLSIDPAPQPIDPPRPETLMRAYSAGDVDMEYEEPALASQVEIAHMVTSKGIEDESTAEHMEVHLGEKSALDRFLETVASGSDLLGDLDPATSSFSSSFGEPWPTSNRPDRPGRSGHELDEASLSPRAASAQDLRPSSMNAVSDDPVPPVKDARKTREELILAKKRELRRREYEDLGHGSLAPPTEDRLRRRRSRSTGDVPRLAAMRSRHTKSSTDVLLDVFSDETQDGHFADVVERELTKLGSSARNYRVRERVETIYASSDVERFSRSDAAADGEVERAWRTIKRPSDVNEFSAQIKELRTQEIQGKAHGKVFVKVVGVKDLNLPLPSQPTLMTCTLNNGIHFVTTPECPLGRDSRIEQEFELIEHSKLEFTLTVKVRRDPHIIAQMKMNAPAPVVQPRPAPPPPASKGGGMRNFFRGSSPAKKTGKALPAPVPVQPPRRLEENLARYLKPDGTLGRAFISFKDIARRCDTKLFETTYPLIGQKTDSSTSAKTMQVGSLVLQVFRLPPLQGISPEQLPQSLDECHRGLRHVSWHKTTYFEGTLTQNGGDCKSWRRRHLRIVGANLIAYNDVTKKATMAVDLKKAIAVQDFHDLDASARHALMDEWDGPYGIEHSFRLIFTRHQEIVFFADSDEDKVKWLEVLRAIVGHIPPNPLWGEVLWQRRTDQLASESASGSTTSRS